MMTFRVVRDPMSKIPDGTTGRLLADSFSCVTLEPPWRDNAPSVSCIPVGTYEVAMAFSPRFGRDMPHVLNVPGRDGILFHPLNFPAQTEGCIGTGTAVMHLGIIGSRVAFGDFLAWLHGALAEGPVSVEISDGTT